MKSLISFEKFNPLRRPEWRSDRVIQMCDRPGDNPGRTTPRDDGYIREFRKFYLRYAAADEAGRNALAYANPGLYFAFTMHEQRTESPEMPMLLEARILAGQSDEEIAAELHTVPEMVNWYEGLFFNVRDRLHAHDWIVHQVLMPAIREGRAAHVAVNRRQGPGNAANPNDAGVANSYSMVSEPYFDATIKFFAYFGKAFVLDFVITGFQRGFSAISREEVGSWFDQHYYNRLKHRASMAVQSFAVNRYNVMQLFELNNQIINIQKSAKDDAAAEGGTQKAIAGMLMGMSWAVGEDGAKMVANTPIAAYDNGAAEPRDDALMLLAAGGDPGKMDLPPCLPPPKKKQDYAAMAAQQAAGETANPGE